MLKLLLGDPNARKLKRYQPIVSDINLLEEEIAPSATTTCADARRSSASVWITPARSTTSVLCLMSCYLRPSR